MSLDENHPVVQQMLAELHRQTDGEPSRSASMYDLGQAIGLDRDAAQETGEALIGSGLAAIVSLSGSIGLTPEGLGRIEAERTPTQRAGGVPLGDGPELSEPGREAVDRLLATLKHQVGQCSWDYDLLAELMADIRTVEAQLASPRPKTPIVKACLVSVRELRQRAGEPESLAMLDELLL